jgi:DNA polymerase-1
MSSVLTLDIETHSKELLYSMEPHEFVRLSGFAWGNEAVQLTTDLEELKEQIKKARLIVGHNIHTYDLRAIFGIRSDVPMVLADQNRVYDTFTHAVLVHPTPNEYTNRDGVLRKAPAEGWSPEQMLPWFGLDEQAFQLGVAGKTADLKELAFEFGDPSLSKKAREADGFGKIPLDDERYRDYLIGDVEASREVGKALLKKGKLDAYAMREQRIESRKATISSNGWRTDKPAAEARRDALKARREVLMAELVEKYDFPTEGDAPWKTNPGKNAIMAVLADHGIHPSKDWPKTKGRAKLGEAQEKARAAAQEAVELKAWLENEIRENPKFRRVKGTQNNIKKLEEQSVVPNWFGLSLGGDALKDLTKGTAIEDLGKALAELMGQRSLSQLALDCTYPDGFVHPEITMLQRSGRWSTTEPGLTIWTSRGEGAVEKSYFLPDNDDHVLIEIDLSNADARVVAALSGDKKYAERFEPGEDSHLHNAWAAWGKEEVGADKKDPKTAGYRFRAKALGHGWNYGGQAKTLSQQAGVPLADGKRFCDGMAEAFSQVIKWQNKTRRFANQHGYVENLWGRKMVVEKGHEFTQAPALLGQSGTREIMCDALLAFSYSAVRSIKAQIHDAMVFSVPKKDWEKYRDYLKGKMESSMNPPGGQFIEFPADCGPAGANWQLACH